MGSSISTTSNYLTQQITPRRENLYKAKTKAEQIRSALPLYYVDEIPTRSDYEVANNSWNLVLDNTAAGFIELTPDQRSKYSTCVSYFYDLYYARLFEVHPTAKAVFKSLKSQGKALIKMVSLCLKASSHEAKLGAEMKRIANIHYNIGISSNEYGVVGEVLFWTLNKILSDSYFAGELQNAWVRIFSVILRYLVPNTVYLEMDEIKRVKKGTRESISYSKADESDDEKSFFSARSGASSFNFHMFKSNTITPSKHFA